MSDKHTFDLGDNNQPKVFCDLASNNALKIFEQAPLTMVEQAVRADLLWMRSGFSAFIIGYPDTSC